MTILEQLAGYARETNRKSKTETPAFDVEATGLFNAERKFAFENAIKKPELSFICECKKRLHPEGSSLVIFHIYRLQKSMRTPEQTVFPY